MYSTKNIVERKTKTPERALSALMRLASRAEKSSGDALRLMRGWGLSDKDAQSVLAQLVDMQFIDDQRFTTAYVREKTRLAGWGGYKIRAGLRAKGIAVEMIEKAFDGLENRDKKEGEERLKAALERKKRSIKSADRYEIRNKLMRFGLSRGHDFDEIEPVINEILKGKDENI